MIANSHSFFPRWTFICKINMTQFNFSCFTVLKHKSYVHVDPDVFVQIPTAVLLVGSMRGYV